jgi:hypothetical protein
MSNPEIELTQAYGIKVAALRLYRGGESATVAQDLYRAFRTYSVKHDPREMFFNDPVTVFHI